MKRIICALLTVVMLAAMIPAFAVTSSAENNVSAIKLNITHSQEECTGSAASVDWSAIWDTNNLDAIKSGMGSRIEANTAVVGVFDKPTTVSKIELCQASKYSTRTNGMKVLLFNIATNEWETVVTVEGASTDVVGAVYTFDNLNTGDKVYSKIKVLRESAYYHNLLWAAAYTDQTCGRINVTHVSDSKNSADVDFSKIWNIENTDRLGYQFDSAVEIIGEFEKATPVTHIVFMSVYHHWRLTGIKVSLSNDKETWVDALTIPKYETNTTGSYQQWNYPLKANGEFKYIKITQDTDYSNNGWYQFDINWVAVYNNPGNGADFENINHVLGYNNAVTDSIWDFSSNSHGGKSVGSVNPGSILAVGEFNTPTVIETIYLNLHYSYEARNSKIQFEASVDGITWNQIAIAGNFEANSDTGILEVNDNTAYKFVRVKKNTPAGWWWTIHGIAFVGEAQAPEANTTEADFYGVQTKVDADAWALRLISTVDSLDFKAVGYEIKVTGLDKDGTAVEKFFDKYTQTVYTSVMDNMGTRNAKALGGNYIFTATINGISIEKYAALTFEIKPYVADEKGQKTYGETQTYTFEDGVQK